MRKTAFLTALVLHFVTYGRWPALDEARRPLFAHRTDTKSGPTRDIWSVVHGDWHLIQRGERFELFDLAADPAERENLAQRRPEVVARLARELARHRAREATFDSGPTVDVEIDGRRLEELEALGYVQ